jgi:ABC-2 type transport system ATP-binding protein
MIAVENLHKAYGDRVALDEVTFTVPKGEIFGFVGPNGAGKTTTIRILATLSSADAGEATVGGIPVHEAPADVRNLIGYMPDFFGVYDRLTSAEYLEFYAACHGVPRRKRAAVARELLELVDLSDRRDAQVDTLSRGMKQRLGLARALVHDPAVLLLDEPASGLDPRARVEMKELIRELSRMGKTILISSHILPELEELCTWVGFIDGGRMAAAGPMAEVRDAVVAGFASRWPTTASKSWRARRSSSAPTRGSSKSPGCRTTSRSPSTSRSWTTTCSPSWWVARCGCAPSRSSPATSPRSSSA